MKRQELYRRCRKLFAWAKNSTWRSIYSWWKFREAAILSLHNLSVLSQIWTCLLLHPSVFPSVSYSDCLPAYTPTYQLPCLSARLPAWLSVLICVTPLGHQVHLCHSQTPGTLPNAPRLALSVRQPAATADLCWDEEKRNSVFFSAPMIRDKGKNQGKLWHSSRFLHVLWTYRLEPHMKEIIIKSISHIIVS